MRVCVVYEWQAQTELNPQPTVLETVDIGTYTQYPSVFKKTGIGDLPKI